MLPFISRYRSIRNLLVAVPCHRPTPFPPFETPSILTYATALDTRSLFIISSSSCHLFPSSPLVTPTVTISTHLLLFSADAEIRNLFHLSPSLFSQPLPQHDRVKSPPRMVTITRASAEDCLQLADIQFDAFSPLIVHQRVFGNVTKENHSKHLAEQMRKSMETAGSELYKAVIEDDRGQEKMVGMAWYDRPKGKGQEEEEKKEDEIKTEEEKRAAMKEKFPQGSDFDLAISYFGRIDSDVLHRDVDEPFYHLHLLAIDPSIQRTGAGTVLLKWVLEEADKEGVACYLESSDIGVGLYRRYGFEEFTEPIIAGKDDEMIIWPMRRPPLAQSRTTASRHDK